MAEEEDRARRQAFFDKVVPLVIAQGEKSIDHSGQCLYRGPGGLKCAIGHGIPDERYERNLELGMTARQLLVHRPGTVDGLTANDAVFARQLQIAHDEASGSFAQSFAANAVNVAKDFGLDPSAALPAQQAGAR